jgi:hypothetical protein
MVAPRSPLLILRKNERGEEEGRRKKNRKESP